MNILYIWDADYPWDIRVQKICESLNNNGNEVHIASRNLNKLPVEESLNGVNIHRLKALRNDRINYILSFPLFFSPVWKRFIDNIIATNNIDIIIVRDLPMAIAGIRSGRKFNIPVIFDMAEDYVAMINDIWKVRKYQGLNLVIRNPYFAKLVERYTFKNVDHTLVVVEEAIEIVKQEGGDTGKITIVSNTPELTSFSDKKELQDDVIDFIQSHYSVIYTGGIQMGRGIQCVLDAIPEIVQEIPDFLFVIVGDGYAKETLNKMIAEKSLENHVLWAGWIEHSKLYDYIRACKIGIIPHLVTNHVDTTIPNKIFDYMGCGIPVISTNAKPMRRIVEKEQCGITFLSDNPGSISEAIIEVFNTDVNYGKNGEQAVRTKYNWREDEKRLNGVLEMFK